MNPRRPLGRGLDGVDVRQRGQRRVVGPDGFISIYLTWCFPRAGMGMPICRPPLHTPVACIRCTLCLWKDHVVRNAAYNTPCLPETGWREERTILEHALPAERGYASNAGRSRDGRSEDTSTLIHTHTPWAWRDSHGVRYHIRALVPRVWSKGRGVMEDPLRASLVDPQGCIPQAEDARGKHKHGTWARRGAQTSLRTRPRLSHARRGAQSL